MVHFKRLLPGIDLIDIHLASFLIDVTAGLMQALSPILQLLFRRRGNTKQAP